MWTPEYSAYSPTPHIAEDFLVRGRGLAALNEHRVFPRPRSLTKKSRVLNRCDAVSYGD